MTLADWEMQMWLFSSEGERGAIRGKGVVVVGDSTLVGQVK